MSFLNKIIFTFKLHFIGLNLLTDKKNNTIHFKDGTSLLITVEKFNQSSLVIIKHIDIISSYTNHLIYVSPFDSYSLRIKGKELILSTDEDNSIKVPLIKNLFNLCELR